MGRTSRVAAIAIAIAGCSKDRGPTPIAPEDHDAPPAATISASASASASAPNPPVDEGFFEAGPIGSATAITHPGAPTVRYAAMNQATCEAELGKRTVAFVRAAPTVGVLAPVRLRGPLHGVTIHSALPAAQVLTSEIEIFDCRLVLALDDFAAMIAKHDVVEMIHLSAYRSQRNGGCTPKYVGKQHCAGLALDVGTYKKKDGSTLDVKRDFSGKIGIATCGPGTHPIKPGPASNELWGYVCDAANRGLFNVILTPNFNQQHENHMHLEVTPDAEWMLIH